MMKSTRKGAFFMKSASFCTQPSRLDNVEVDGQSSVVALSQAAGGAEDGWFALPRPPAERSSDGG